MKPCQFSTNEWGVIDADHKLLIDGLPSNAAAWAWIDEHSHEGRDATDRHNRIRDAFAER
jgi:hypothetical protein